MKNLTNISLVIVLFLATVFTSCKKGDEAGPRDENGDLVNTAQLFLDDNATVSLQGNDLVAAEYKNGYLNVVFSQNGTGVEMQIPNYDINAAHGEYNNTNIDFSLKRDAKLYYSSNIFIPVVAGNPPHPVFVTDKTITIKTTNLKVDPNTTDISIQIVSGSELITMPVSNGAAPVYERIAFIQGAGGKPNMINLHIKQ